ncbi:MAG: glycerophosphodiester phosphodiesterase family protein [Ilumatobacteraceae bacterium]
MQREFRAYAHRGGSEVAPENSPAAFAAAVRLGYRWLETDLRATRDGVAVVHHDPVLDRTTDMSGPVIARAWSDVRRARFDNGESPLRLEELLAAHPDASINLDLTPDAVVAPALDALRRARAWHRVCLTSFSTRRLRAARRWAPGHVETSAGPAEVVLQRATPPGLSRWRPGPAGRQSRPRRAGPARLQVPARLVTATYVRRAHAQSLPVDAWTVNDPAEMDRLLRIDVDGIMTDAPALLRDVLRSHGRW